MRKVYVAGKLNDDAPMYLQHMHRMNKTARVLRNAGYSVYVPCNDFIEGLIDGNFGYNDYFDNSQPWLKCSDAIFLTPGWEDSTGTKREIDLALSFNIPVFDSLEKMNEHFGIYQA